MKRLHTLCLFLAMLFGLGFNASALTVTLEWDIPGSIFIRTGSLDGETVDLGSDQTSYTFKTDATFGYIYAFASEGYYITGAATTDGSKTYNLNTYTTPNSIIGSVNSSVDGKTIKIDVIKIERNDSFSIDLVNGEEYVSASFNSEYTLDLEEGDREYKFNPEIDKSLTLYLKDIPSAYKVTLNGTEIEKNAFNPRYDVGAIKPGDKLFIQVFDGEGPKSCAFTIEYGPGMEGCLMNIYNRSTGNFIYAADMTDNSITVPEGTNLRVNLLEDDYNITRLSLNGADVTSDFSGGSLLLTVSEENTVLKIEGEPKAFSTIDFTGYIINAEGVDFSLTYGGEPFAISEGTPVSEDIKVNSSLTMPASETREYIISVSEKQSRFFFAPKKGFYISSVYTVTPEGRTEQHSGSASMSATLDGTTFYMVVNKLPEEYTAGLNIIGEDFYMKISANQPVSDNWGNPSTPTYASTSGEREISFIPGYGTPINFSFIGEEGQSPAIYLDGVAVNGVEDSESGALVFSVTPYSPADEKGYESGIHSSITVYNSFTERPAMSGASLDVEEGAQAEFFYSPVLHKADPAGQPAISGTQFTVRPASSDMTVTYKGEQVELDENGEFVFNATGNARNNVEKVSPKPSVVELPGSDAAAYVSVFSIDGRVIMENVPPCRLRELEKGLYIVNGKKTVVR